MGNQPKEPGATTMTAVGFEPKTTSQIWAFNWFLAAVAMLFVFMYRGFSGGYMVVLKPSQ
jgi:hypothetical protein